MGAEDLIPHGDFVRGTEPRVSGVDIAALHAAQPLLDARARSFRDRVLPGLHALHVNAHAALEDHSVVAGAACHVGGVRAGHHRLGRDAPGVDARPAEQMALDDGDRHAGTRQPVRKRGRRLPGADDDRVVFVAHWS